MPACAELGRTSQVRSVEVDAGQGLSHLHNHVLLCNRQSCSLNSLERDIYIYIYAPPLQPTFYQQIISCAVNLTDFLPFLLQYKLYRIQHCVRLGLLHSETSIAWLK